MQSLPLSRSARIRRRGRYQHNFRKEIYQLPYLEMDHIVDDIARVAADADGQIRYDNFVKLMQN